MGNLQLTYDIADIPSGLFDPARMDDDIRDPAVGITRALVGSSRGTGVNADKIYITFVGDGALDAADKTKLDGDTSAPAGGVIGAHTGDPLPATSELVKLDAPTEADGKPTIVIAPNTQGYMTFFTGAGDDPAPEAPASGRGTGTPIGLDFAGPETQTVEIQFVEPVEMHDGQLWYTPVANWAKEDKYNFSAVFPAAALTPNAGAGDCNLVPVGAGINIVVPAAGDGSHDVDLALSKAAPVWANSAGYWDVLDLKTGAVTPSTTPGAAQWNLFDFEIESFFLRNMPMGHPLGVFDIDTYKAEWISPAWKLRLKVVKVSANAGEVAGWLMLFRENST